VEKLDEILRRVAAGEITPDQAEQQIRAKPRLGRPKKDKKQVRVAGRIIEIKPRRKATHHIMDIGRRYVELRASGKKSSHAIAIIQRSARNRKEPLSDGTILKYEALYRLKCSERDLNDDYERKSGRYIDVAEMLRDMLSVMDSLGIQVDPETVSLEQDGEGAHYFVFIANVSGDLGDRIWMKFWPNKK
jgi:hypothetical protein